MPADLITLGAEAQPSGLRTPVPVFRQGLPSIRFQSEDPVASRNRHPDGFFVLGYKPVAVRLHSEIVGLIAVAVLEHGHKARSAEWKLQVHAAIGFGAAHSVAIHIEESEDSGEHPGRFQSVTLLTSLRRRRALPAQQRFALRGSLHHTVSVDIEMPAAVVGGARRIGDRGRARYKMSNDRQGLNAFVLLVASMARPQGTCGCSQRAEGLFDSLPLFLSLHVTLARRRRSVDDCVSRSRFTPSPTFGSCSRACRGSLCQRAKTAIMALCIALLLRDSSWKWIVTIPARLTRACQRRITV